MSHLCISNRDKGIGCAPRLATILHKSSFRQISNGFASRKNTYLPLGIFAFSPVIFSFGVASEKYDPLSPHFSSAGCGHIFHHLANAQLLYCELLFPQCTGILISCKVHVQYNETNGMKSKQTVAVMYCTVMRLNGQFMDIVCSVEFI